MAVQNCKLKLVRVVPLLIWVVPLLIWWVVPLLIWAVPLLIWWVGGLTVIIGLVSVQVKLKLELPTGTELGKKNIQNKLLDQVGPHPPHPRWKKGTFVSKYPRGP